MSTTTRPRGDQTPAANGAPDRPDAVAAMEAIIEHADLAPRQPAEEGQERGPIDAEAQLHNLRAAARDLRYMHEADGLLTQPLLEALEPLLYAPIPERYIETVEAGSKETRSGEPWPPFDMTGIAGAGIQVQADRMNAVLGLGHWRYLTRHAEGGTLCYAVVMVGNDLAHARLDTTGQVEPGEARVLAAVEGWGGYARGRLGDAYKGSETNALKRVIARLGPGAEVYRLEADDPAAPAPELPAAEPPAPAVAAGEDPEQALRELLAAEGDLRDLRVECAQGMDILGAPYAQQVRELRTADTPAKLRTLATRISNAVTAQEGAQGA